MSLKMFIIFSSLVGGLCAYLGWALGLWIPYEGFLRASMKGCAVGLTIGLGLSYLDGRWNSKGTTIWAQSLVAGTLGAAGGLLGGLIGEGLFKLHFVFSPVGWTITGLFIGLGLVMFEIYESIKDSGKKEAAMKKAGKCLLGGGLGGAAGGILFLLFQLVWNKAFGPGLFWTPAALGFSALGLCIGLFIGLTQVLLKDAWVKVESGRSRGKELLLCAPRLVMGRDEGCQLGLFGDPNIAKQHAAITKKENSYFVEDLGSSDGTFVNNRRISGLTALQSEDMIQLGKTKVRFLEVAKR